MVVAERGVVEDDEEGVERDRRVVLVVRRADVGRVRRVGRVKRLDVRVVRNALDDLNSSYQFLMLEKGWKETHSVPIRIQGAQNTHDLDHLPPRLLRRLRLEQPDQQPQQRRVVEIRVDHIRRVRPNLAQRPQRGVPLRRRRLVVERVEDEGHKGVQLWEDVLTADSSKFAEGRED